MKVQIYLMFFVFSLISCVPEQLVSETETPTQIPSPIPTLTQTPEYVEDIEFSMLSPDGTKIIQTTDWWETFDIIDLASNKVLWSFSYDKAKFGEGHMYLGEAVYSPFYWSQNGKYIYVFARQGWDGGVKYFGDAFGAEEGVARFDITTGIMTDVLPERYGGGYTFSISPDEKSIFYIDQRETPLVLRFKDLLTNEEQTLITFDENLLDVGDYAWSPEGDKFVFQTMSPDGIDFILFDYKTQKFEPIVTGIMEAINFEFWGDGNKLYYADWENTTWQLDLDTKTLKLIDRLTLTPKP